MFTRSRNPITLIYYISVDLKAAPFEPVNGANSLAKFADISA